MGCASRLSCRCKFISESVPVVEVFFYHHTSYICLSLVHRDNDETSDTTLQLFPHRCRTCIVLLPSSCIFRAYCIRLCLSGCLRHDSCPDIRIYVEDSFVKKNRDGDMRHIDRHVSRMLHNALSRYVCTAFRCDSSVRSFGSNDVCLT